MLKIVLEKGLFTSKNGWLCLTKGQLDKPEGQVEVNFSLIKKLFLKLLIQIMKKEFFWKRTLSNKASDPKLFLPGIHPVSCQCTGLQLRDLFKHAVEAGSEHNVCQYYKVFEKTVP